MLVYIYIYICYIFVVAILKVVSYETQSNASRVAYCVDAAARGVDMDGRAVGDVHAIVAGTTNLSAIGNRQ